MALRIGALADSSLLARRVGAVRARHGRRTGLSGPAGPADDTWRPWPTTTSS
ncbi:hypothetical protein ACRAWD_18755 [Caulobacter segnis]